MLVLSRHAGEQFRIGDDIVIKFLGLENGAARIGVHAPKSLIVIREELELTEEQRAEYRERSRRRRNA